MASLSITAANVLPGSNAVIKRGNAGATITAGQVVYLDTATTGEWLLADADAAAAITRGSGQIGIALHGASDGQPLSVQVDGNITIGATMTAGLAYYLSPTPGGIGVYGDVLSGDYVCLVGLSTSTTVLALNFFYTGVAL
jgi:hypothetical protein